MADSTRCISALNRAAGRELSADEVQDVFERIQRTARDLQAGRVKPTGGPQNLATADGLIRHAAELEAANLQAEAQRKLANTYRDIEIQGTLRAQVDAMKGGGIDDVDAVLRLLVNTADGRANQFSLEARVKGVSTELKRRLQDTWAAMDRSVFDYFQKPDKVKLLLEEIRGKDTGDATARKAAQEWKNTAEMARQWFNEKGGKIGHLEDWGLPQHHSQDLVSRAAGGTDVAANRQAWVDFVFDRLDRSRYVDIAGNRMSDAEVRTFLDNAWTTIATGGANKIEPGRFTGNSARANRHAEQRQIHFRDADATLEYWSRFAERTVPDILLGHVETMARDIAFVEHFGSNPEASFRLLRDTAEQAAKVAKPHEAAKIDKALRAVDTVFDYAAGKVAPTVDRRVSGFFDIMHNLNTAAKLGSAFWASAIGDKVMFEALGHLNQLPAYKRWWNEIRLLNPTNAADRRQLRRHGLMLDYMTQAMHRFGDDYGKSSFTGKLANGVMKVSGMAAVNEWRRGAWALTAMDTLGHIVSRKEFGQVGAQDMRLLASYGITEADWKVWKLAKLDDLGHGNSEALTPEAVGRISDISLREAGFDNPASARRDATVKLLGALTSESHLAVIEPGWKQRAQMYGGLQRGKLRDELTRSFWQFKSFPMAQFENTIALGLSRETAAGKAAFLTAMPVAMTLAGAMMIQVQELLAGRDPRPMWDWKFAVAAFLKGGSLGIYGDFMFSGGQTRMGSGPLEAVAGPTIGLFAELANLAAKAKQDIEKGEPDRTAARALALGKTMIPAQNLWMTKAATDHLVFQKAQEALNPGYLRSVQARTEREYGNEWWWEPGETTPTRAPNLGGAFEGR